jgi:hypothetical protein
VTRGRIYLLFSTAIALVLAGCGGGTTQNVQNPPPPPEQSVSIVFDPAPPAKIPVNETAKLTAVVKDDSSDAGVDWSVTCQDAGNCGSLSPLHTESGGTAIYTPPANVIGNQQTVSIAAFATADHNKNVLTPLTVVGFAANLAGTYIIQTTGVDGSGFSYQFAAAVVLDGNGQVTGGEQTYCSILLSSSDAITGGGYSIGPDGRGILALTIANQSLGQLGVETFHFVLLSDSHAVIARIDNPDLDPSTESSSGTLDLQTSKATPTGGYAFVLNGSDMFADPDSIGGVMNVDSANTISGNGSIADQDLAGTLSTNASLTGTVSNPDSFGAVKLSITTAFSGVPMLFTGYIVDSTHIKLIETDGDPNTGLGAATAGVAIGQGSATGTFTDNSAFYGDFVFGVLGVDLNLFLPNSLISVGHFTADGQGNLANGYNDIFMGGLFTRISDKLTGHYKVDASGTGRVHASTKFKKQGINGPDLFFYLTGNGNPPLVLHADSDNFTQGTGLAYPSVPASSLSGKLAVSYTQNLLIGIGNDAVGEVTADDSAGTLAGIVDTNEVFIPVLDTVINGTFAATDDPIRMKGTLANEAFGANPDGISVAYYLIDSDHALFLELDSPQTGQVTFGSLTPRTPICPGCP